MYVDSANNLSKILERKKNMQGFLSLSLNSTAYQLLLQHIHSLRYSEYVRAHLTETFYANLHRFILGPWASMGFISPGVWEQTPQGDDASPLTWWFIQTLPLLNTAKPTLSVVNQAFNTCVRVYVPGMLCLQKYKTGNCFLHHSPGRDFTRCSESLPSTKDSSNNFMLLRAHFE